MTKSILTILLFIFGFTDGFSQFSKTKYEGVVEYFVDCIINSDIDKLDSIISYPIERPYPIPSINNKQELKKRYSEIFDDSLTSIISCSNIKEDWTDMGWSGIMLHNGIVWLDYDGQFLTTNYTSEKEKALEEKWIESEREQLYINLKDFIKPIHTLETEKFILRIDLLENQKYRYASWSIESDLSNKPDLVINNGEWTPDGSGGNHHFTFTNGEYSYIVDVNILRSEETPPFTLEVTKNDKVLLKHPAELKKIK
ncbi:hypothetical protein [Cyclobacterium amurskyense]|uniref:Uncharacterized protein n=1 Tax=Cyclobacterium amurskyense TaxID=320787 RepID=A0A0H4PAR8_9BACT|nr:hypothetical protein [Cyclobacterium amurskyense]AKP50235.1 hypothetical protein CA2015_0776 [Cyclobacterium amurskyense]